MHYLVRAIFEVFVRWRVDDARRVEHHSPHPVLIDGVEFFLPFLRCISGEELRSQINPYCMKGFVLNSKDANLWLIRQS